MYCSACGKKCPEGARFCAFCGEKLPELPPEKALTEELEAAAANVTAATTESAPVSSAQAAPAKAEPEQLDLDLDELAEGEPLQAGPERTAAPTRLFQKPQQAFQRTDDTLTVRPLAANPAQPLRGAEAAAVFTAESAEELPPEMPDELDAGDEAEAVEPTLRRSERRARQPLPEEDDEWVRPAKSRAAAPEPEDDLGDLGDLGEDLDDDLGDDPDDDLPPKASRNKREERPARHLLFGREKQPAKRPPYEHPAEPPAKRSPYAREEEHPAKHSPYEHQEEQSAKRSPYAREEERPVRRSPYEQEEQAAKRSPYARGAEHPPKHPAHAEERPTKRAPYERDDERPAASVRPDRLKSARSVHGKAVTASGGMVTPPSRRSPGRSASPFGPRKQSKGKKDLFFEDMEVPAENYYDEVAEERTLARRIKSIVAIALAAGVLLVALWLMFTPGGQMVRAQLNLGAPATAYKDLGDQNRAGGQIQRAADAYYNALRLDPKNYEYALLVGQTQYMIGNREKAITAYKLCVVLKPTEVEPYKQLIELYTVMGDAQAAESVRAEGYKQTGDASLAPAA